MLDVAATPQKDQMHGIAGYNSHRRNRMSQMDKPRIRMGHPYGQTPPNVYSDFDWVHRHEKELLEKYGECSIIVYQQQVLGTGPTYAAALEDAERNLPPTLGEITSIHQWLQHRHPFLRVRFVPTSDVK
jgi:hypothetical protein